MQKCVKHRQVKSAPPGRQNSIFLFLFLQVKNKILHTALHSQFKFLGIHRTLEVHSNKESNTYVRLCTSSFDSSCNIFKDLKR